MSLDVFDFTPFGWGSRIATGNSITQNVNGKKVTGGLYGLGKSVVNTAAGQSSFQPDINPITGLPDQDNIAVNAANAQAQAAYQKQLADWNARQAQWNSSTAHLNTQGSHLDPKTGKMVPGTIEHIDDNGNPVTFDEPQPQYVPPTPEDVAATQILTDRARLLGTNQGYTSDIKNLQLAAQGQGPSAAQDTLREGTARAQAGAYGMASSGNVAPGQRAALLGAASQQAAMQGQQGARDSAVLRAQETNAARTQLGGALAGQANVESGLYAGNQETDLANQQANIEKEKIKAGIASSNAQQAGETSRAVIGGVAHVIGGGR